MREEKQRERENRKRERMGRDNTKRKKRVKERERADKIVREQDRPIIHEEIKRQRPLPHIEHVDDAAYGDDYVDDENGGSKERWREYADLEVRRELIREELQR